MRIVSLCFLGVLIAFLTWACNTQQPTPEPTPGDKVFATGLKKPDHRDFGVLFFSPNASRAIPDHLDWRESGIEMPVRNQGSCGSCWAFGGTQAIEMGYATRMQKIDFSEQQLVGNLYDGCGGGYFVYDFQVKYGQTDEAHCPYSANNHKCSTSLPAAGRGVGGGLVGATGRRPTVEEIQTTIMTYGAAPVTVCANSRFMNYSGGLGDVGPQCETNHIVALVGWKTVNSKVYFLVKNSWGTDWGEKGYGWFQLGAYNLGEEASWLAVDAVPCKPPVVKLPAEYVLYHGDEVFLGVKAQQGVSYEWSESGKVIGTDSWLDYTADKTTVLLLKAKNACGNGEIQTQITVK